MPLVVYHVQVDDLDADTAWAIAGIHSSPDRPMVAARLFAAGRYAPVARMDRDDPTPIACEVAFTVTQNIDVSWSRQPPAGLTVIEPSSEYGWRSTMVGDVIEVGGKRFVVLTQGFAEVPHD